MKLDVILGHRLYEADSSDMLSQLRKSRDDDIKVFTNIRNTLSRKEIAFLSRMIKRKREKRGMTANIPDSTLATFTDLKLANRDGKLTTLAPRFLKWVNRNPSREMDFVDKRSDANDSLGRGHLKRDDEWTDPLQKRARKIVKSLSDDEKDIFKKVYNRYINKRTRNLSKSWGNVPDSDLIKLQRLDILDNNGNLTDVGEFSVKYYMTFKDDPDGLDRIPRGQRVGNFGTARDRRQARADKITRPR